MPMPVIGARQGRTLMEPATKARSCVMSSSYHKGLIAGKTIVVR